MRRQLIRRFSAACVLAEELEGRLARGEEIDVERHALLCCTLTRLAQRIGIDRRAKNITPSLGDYLRSSPPPDVDARPPNELRIPIAASFAANCSTAWSKR